MKKYIILLICSVLLSGFNSSYSQNATEKKTKKRICLTHNYKHKTRYFREGKGVKFLLKNDSVVKKGRIEQMQDSALVIKGKTYKISEFSMIKGRPIGMVFAKVGGGAIASFGGYMVVEGIMILSQANSNADDEWAKFANTLVIIAGTVVTLAGGVVVMVGTVPLIINMKKFELENKWTMKVVEK